MSKAYNAKLNLADMTPFRFSKTVTRILFSLSPPPLSLLSHSLALCQVVFYVSSNKVRNCKIKNVCVVSIIYFVLDCDLDIETKAKETKTKEHKTNQNKTNQLFPLLFVCMLLNSCNSYSASECCSFTWWWNLFVFILDMILPNGKQILGNWS